MRWIADCWSEQEPSYDRPWHSIHIEIPCQTVCRRANPCMLPLFDQVASFSDCLYIASWWACEECTVEIVCTRLRRLDGNLLPRAQPIAQSVQSTPIASVS
eukprot:6206774-Amphidinium_carterae.1